MRQLHRPGLIVVLALLVLCMQYEGYVHPYTHLPPRLGQIDGPEFSVIDNACGECVLFAGASSAIPFYAGGTKALSASFLFVSSAFTTRAAELPSWFRSRAPPIAV